jgi:predicted nucleic-acid-binding protein
LRAALDTSVVLRLLIGEPPAQAERAWQLVVEVLAEGGTLCVSDLVVSEAYFALQHHYRVPKGEALAQLRAFLSSGEIESTGCAAAVLATPQLDTAKPGFVDRLIHGGYLRHADAVVSFEKSARRLPRTRVLGEAP